MTDLEQVHARILEANPPPRRMSSLKATIAQLQEKRYQDKQFQLMQARTQMNPYTLKFAPMFEEAYRRAVHEENIVQVRKVFFLGFVVYLLFLIFDYVFVRNSKLNANVLILDFGVAIPAFLIGVALTYLPGLKRHLWLETLVCAIFFIVASVVIVKKPIEGLKGPMLELILLLIPIFGITRMRFITSCMLGASIVLTNFAVQVYAAYNYQDRDPASAIMYQNFNYAIRIFGGAVSHYRQEILRRRNFALQLPFNDNDAPNAKLECSMPPNLLEPWSLKFQHPEIESSFFQYWYLIDPFPFENIYNPFLHRGAFRAIRGALVSVILSQFLLVYQDTKLLDHDNLLQVYAYIARCGIVLPAYLLLSAAIYFVSQKFVNAATEAAQESHGTLKSDEMVLIVTSSRGGYVRHVQQMAGVVVLLHIAAMSTLVLLIYDHSNDTNLSDLYFMGYLNAVLFVHRSGFRVRFQYASLTTGIAVIAFIIASSTILPRVVCAEYSLYAIAVCVLGSLSSYEEEKLRRTFFVFKSLRSLEFDTLYRTVIRIQEWIRFRLKKKLQRIRGQNQPGNSKSQPHVPSNLAAATNAGIVGQLVEVVASIV